jgi:hypothetical protein
MKKIQLEPAVIRLREVWQQRQAEGSASGEYGTMLATRDDVLARFQPVFRAGNLKKLTEESFREFLGFKNNRHWMRLERKGPFICSDMARLRQALAILLDESRPIEERLDKLVPVRGPALVPHLGKAVLTPILLIHDPKRYGVWNRVSEEQMRTLSAWPDVDGLTAFGQRYLAVNDVLLRLAEGVGVDLWTLDALWWRVSASKSESAAEPTEEGPGDTGVVREGCEPAEPARFGLERHLHEFLRDNWDHTELGRSWKIWEKDGDPDAGYEYPTDVGPIDLLAKHRSEHRWLVIELKRQQSSDKTVGQVLRYMGWVKSKLAKPGESVEGLIISHSDDETVRYALAAVQDVSLRLYEVQFRLKDPGGQ